MFSNELIERFKQIETPFYYYDLNLLRKTLDEVKKHGMDHGFHVHYALKSNFDNDVLKVIQSYGLGIDAVSGNEIKKAIETGFSAKQVVFAGVGKTDAEITYALSKDIFCFNCESPQEIEVLNELAQGLNKTARIALRINPNVDPKTHKYITTGLSENKFGINPWELDELLEKVKGLNNVNLEGIHFHIGSQITDVSRYQILCGKILEITKVIEAKEIILKHINVGGGLGIDYQNPDENPISPFNTYFDVFKNHLSIRPDQELHFELGRSITGQCGSLITKVLFVKPAKSTNFAIVDAGMTELIRPMLYDGYHVIESLTSQMEDKVYDIVGPICESTDTFQKGTKLSTLKRGDLIAIRSAGAYGQVMSSQYNLRDFVRSHNSDQLD